MSSLVADPTNSNRFYASVPATVGGGSLAVAGVYRSVNGGSSWSATTALPSGLSSSFRILLSSGGTTGVVYAMEINNSGTLSGVFRSADQGTTWAAMGTPSPSIFPGFQGSVHGSVVADPADPNVVFIAGDRQNSPFPNVNGASRFSGTVFRGVFSVSGTTWQNVVMNGNGGGANGTSPHPDSRAMVFDANGNILQSNDGGIYRLVSPNSPGTRIWQSVNGNITPTEAHSAAYDSFSHLVVSGNQDNGTSFQLTPGGSVWGEFIGGDGGDVAVDTDQTAHPGTSIRYSSFTGLQSFNRSFWDSTGNFVGFNFVGLNITSGPGAGQKLRNFDPNIRFYQPYVLNTIDPSRMLIGTQNIYESLNRGDSLANLGGAGGQVGTDFSGNTGMAYGGRLNGVANPDVFYAGAGTTIKHRMTSGGPITTLSSYPGGAVFALTMDPQNDTHVFVLDSSNQVWSSFDEGATWTNLTANLNTLSDLGTGSDLRTMTIFSPDATPRNTVLVVGGQGGVWQMRRPGAAGTIWTTLANGFPHALVYDLSYDYADSVLTAGTLGRGVWTLTSFFRGGGGTGFSATVAGPSSVVWDPTVLPIDQQPPVFALPPALLDAGPPSNPGGSGGAILIGLPPRSDSLGSGLAPFGAQEITISTPDGPGSTTASTDLDTLLIMDASTLRRLVNQPVEDNTSPWSETRLF